MANKNYPLYKKAALTGGANTSLTGGTLKVALVDTDTYAYSDAHEFYSDLSGVVGTPVEITNPTVSATAVLDGDNATFTSVSGSSAEALVIYIDTGVAGTSRLVTYIDTGITGLPVTPNGGDIATEWNASGIVKF